MRLAIILLATILAFVRGHSDPRDGNAGLPKLVGGRKFMASLKGCNIADAVPSVVQERVPIQLGAQLEARFTQNCGSGVGNCDAGYCCSSAGYCGTTTDYCAAPNCQFQYGPGCDANKVPAGASTSSIPRPKIGSIVYGGINTAGVQDCINLNQIAFSFDDGPYLYTKDLLDLLDSYGAKATFFITGNNLGKGEIDDCNTGYPQLIKRMYSSGHQVASHTWSHQDLSTLTTTQFNNQMYYNEMAFRNILGVIPTYMRPPYSSCNITCSNNLAEMGYHVTYFDLDTQGYLNDNPNQIQNSKDIFTNALKRFDPKQGHYLLVEHDIHYQTVYNLTKFMLDTMAGDGWGVPIAVGECLGDPKANWYRSAGSAIATCAAGTYTGVVSSLFAGSTSSTSIATATATATAAIISKSAGSSSSTTATATASAGPQTISKDGTCGGTITCKGSSYGSCCSQYGYCGSTSNYCGTGCQSAFGTCGLLSSSTSSSASATSTIVSTDGSCGGVGEASCLGSTFGNCCSQYGWCGSTSGYCGTGCQSAFGTCT